MTQRESFEQGSPATNGESSDPLRTKSELEPELGLLALQRGFRRRELLGARADNLTVNPGSALDEDRAAGAYYVVPDLVLNALGSAMDHLHALQVSVEGSGGSLMAMSSFTLIRSAIEVLGTGLWILQPDERDERLLRALRVNKENRSQTHAMRKEQGQEDPGFSNIEARLHQHLESRPSLTERSIGRETVTKQLRSIAPLVPGSVRPPLTLWQQASGIAHGNTSMVAAVLEWEQMASPDTSGAADYRVTSSFAKVAMFYDSALSMAEALLNLWKVRNVANS